MTWIKQGRIFNLEPNTNRSTHAQVPTPYVMPDGNIRVYYSCRKDGRAFIAYFDLAKDLKTILKVHEDPIISHGKAGMFDADGVMPSCVIENNGELWMYYIGWSELKNTARYQNEIGIAVSRDGGSTFDRMFKGPIMGRSPTEPGLAVMPFIMRDQGVFKMWYQSGTGWHLIDGKYEPTYVIKYAESKDGVEWVRYPEKCISCPVPELSFSRPWVILKNNVFCMQVCCRDSIDYRGGEGSYKILRAATSDSINFKLDDPYFPGGHKNEFDSSMQCYPSMIEIDDKLVMFYNGNDFGQTGIGVATWE